MADATQRQGFDFSDAPDGGLNLDDIFTSIENPTTGTVKQDPEPKVDEPSSDFFLETATGSKYQTAEEAVKGIEHKDALIAELREKLSRETGIDPIKKIQEPQAPVSYLTDSKKYFEDIKKAKSEEEVLGVQARFVNDVLAPYVPAFSALVKSKAVEAVVSEVPDFSKFYGSQAYKDTLESFPLLKQSIEFSENTPQQSGDLVQLYRLAYDSSTGRTLSKSAPTTRQVETARPTVVSTQQVIPGGTKAVAPTLQSKEGRQAIINQQEAAGVLDFRF